MELPVIIEPSPDRRGFTARLAVPLQLSANAETAEEAHRQLAALLQRRLQEGLQIRTLTVPTSLTRAAAGWLVDDDLTRDWLQQVQEYRADCDAADRERLGRVSAEAETTAGRPHGGDNTRSGVRPATARALA